VDTVTMSSFLFDLAARAAAPALDAGTAAKLAPRPAGYYDDYHTRPPLTRPERVLPPRPRNATPEQLREWSDRCWMIRSMFGSGN
jgi:hypothetical protein